MQNNDSTNSVQSATLTSMKMPRANWHCRQDSSEADDEQDQQKFWKSETFSHHWLDVYEMLRSKTIDCRNAEHEIVHVVVLQIDRNLHSTYYVL